MDNEIKVVVASKNPVKINAVTAGFQSLFATVSVTGVSADSGVSEQPMSDEETLLGAQNRVKIIKSMFPQADFFVGIEGGVERDVHGLTAFAWVVIHNSKQCGEARTTTFRLPPKVALLIDQGMELGHANDQIFGKHNSKQNSGAVGLLTRDSITRTELYRQAVQLALIPFINSDLYFTCDD